MNPFPYMAAAILLGALVTIQPLLNAILARSIGSPYGATTVAIFLAFLCGFAFITLRGNGGEISVRTLTAVPWWVYLTSVIGVLYVAGGVVIAPVTGAFLFFVCVSIWFSVVSLHGVFLLLSKTAQTADCDCNSQFKLQMFAVIDFDCTLNCVHVCSDYTDVY